MAVPIALCDLSWVAYKYRHYYKDSCRRDNNGQIFPVGHVYGTINIVQQLASQYKSVILSVDSHAPHRFEALPEYKSGRHSPTGDPYEDYRIMTDLMNILKICTYQSNVFYIKHDGLESDDIIASWLASSVSNNDWDLSCYFNDVDILQTPGKYHWFRSFHEPEVDRASYLKEKFGLDLDYLPVWWKVVRGDQSDGIPSSIPRFPSKKLVGLCLEAATGLPKDIPWFMQKIGYPFEGAAQIRGNVQRNYDVVCPKVISISEFKLKRLGASLEEVKELLGYYEISDYAV